MTFDFDGWRVAAGLHDTAEKDGNVSLTKLVAESQIVRLKSHGILDIAILEDRRVLESCIRYVIDVRMIQPCETGTLA